MSVHTQVTRWSSRRPQPWKNGGGITYELAAGPEGADMRSFDWRISVAEVASDGPFSTFTGIDRTLVLLEGSVELVVDGRSNTLSSGRSRLSFDGAASTSAHVVAGPVRDLNIMSRRGLFEHRVTALEGGVPVPECGHWFLFAIDHDVAATINTAPVMLDRFDLLQVRGSPESAAVTGPCWLIELRHLSDPA